MHSDTREENKKYFNFELVHEDKHTGARAGKIQTPHGEILTPVFMPVGTHGAIKALQPQELEKMDCRILLCNTYHLLLSPGPDLIKKAKGLHKFMNWPNNILTDSGGFQVFSLQGKSLQEEGARFKDFDGNSFLLSPEISIAVQESLGSDIMMAFDECIPYPATKDYTKNSMDRTHRWLDRCVKSWQNPKQSLFGIVQGSTYLDLRSECVKRVSDFDLPGIAIGGVSVGEGHQMMCDIVSHTAPLLPKNKPRYVMGVGTPEDLIAIWEMGIDMSDCIIPTKYARGGSVYTNRGKIRLNHKNYKRDFYPIDIGCQCYVCKNFSRAYLKHLFDSNEILSAILATTHNIHWFHELSRRARAAILKDEYKQFKEQFLNEYYKNTKNKIPETFHQLSKDED